jgi:hypothetical protein
MVRATVENRLVQRALLDLVAPSITTPLSVSKV